MSSGVPAGASPPPGGRVITSTRGSAFYGCAAVSAAVVVVILGLAFAGGNPTVIAAAILLSLLLGAVIVYGAREVSRWDDLQIVLPQWPLLLGGTQTVELIQRAKISLPNREFPVTGTLLCREKVIYQVGTDTQTEHSEVYNERFSTTGILQDGVFRAAVPIHIPLHAGAPTIDFDHNEIDWRIEFDLSELSRLSAKQSFDLVVAPFLDGGSTAIQDSPRPAT